MNVDEGVPRDVYRQAGGELVTHEAWWVNDLITFCGGQREDESHVKTVNPHTGETRIIGAGSWWLNGTSAELAKWNW